MPNYKISGLTAYPNSTFAATDRFEVSYFSGGIYYSRYLTGTQLLASSSITIGTTAVTSGTTKRVLFQDGSVVSQSANFVFDASNQLVIGGHTGGARIDVKCGGALSTDLGVRVRNSADTVNNFQVNGDGSGGWNVDTKVVKFGSGSSITTGTNNTTTLLNGFGMYNCALANTLNGASQVAYGFQHLNIGGSLSSDGTNTLEIANGTAPTSVGANSIKIYADQLSGGYGTACFHTRDANGDTVKLFKGAAIADATDAASAITQLNLLLARMRVTGGNGLIAN